MRLVIISDTHGRHSELGRLSGDILIHCGDFEDMFQRNGDVLGNVDRWFAKQHFEHIICIGGNHDRTLEYCGAKRAQPFRNATYLQDEEFSFRGRRFYGAPWVPDLPNHAFYAGDAALRAAWAAIPPDVDVLVSHTPPAGILDVSSRGRALGCRHLTDRLAQVRPALHCFGHVHASAGQRVIGETTYVNASSVDSSMTIAHAPVVIDLPEKGACA